MDLQYVSDDRGQITAVQVSIKDWERLKLIHPDIDDMDSSLPEWQKNLLDQRLADMAAHPEKIRPIEELMAILHREV